MDGVDCSGQPGDETDGFCTDAVEDDLIPAQLPISSQAEVDAQCRFWAAEWATDAPFVQIQWPCSADSNVDLPQLDVEIMYTAARTFRSDTGLGWDKLHPRA
eukprot:12178436-Karenia_brevis.AAC.1